MLVKCLLVAVTRILFVGGCVVIRWLRARHALPLMGIVLIASCTNQSPTQASSSAHATPSASCPQPAVTSGHVDIGTPQPQLGVKQSVVTPPPLPVLRSITVSPSGPGTDRVSYKFSGDGTVGWTARFVEAATTRGSNTSLFRSRAAASSNSIFRKRRLTPLSCPGILKGLFRKKHPKWWKLPSSNIPKASRSHSSVSGQ